MTPLAVTIAIPAAVGAAAAFGGAGVLQNRAAHQVPDRPPLRPRLLLDLMRVRSFRWSVVLAAIGFGLQVLALRFGPLGLVQPMLVTGLIFYLAFAAASLHRRVDRPMALAALLALIGLAGFLAISQPASGTGQFSAADVLPIGLLVVLSVSACLLLASRLPGQVRVLPTAAATAVCYGVTAGLVSSLTRTLDVSMVWRRWELWAVVVVGVAGFLLNEKAFQEGTLGAVAVAMTTVGDPLISITVGVVWLGQSLAGGPLRTAVEVVSLMLMAAGIMLLARRSQHVTASLKQDPA